MFISSRSFRFLTDGAFRLSASRPVKKVRATAAVSDERSIADVLRVKYPAITEQSKNSAAAVNKVSITVENFFIT